MRFCELAVLVIPIAACGSNHGSVTVDAANVVPDGPAVPADAMLDAAPTPVGCDLGEQNDQGNDDTVSGTAEATGLSFGGTTTTICGNIDSGHYDTMFNTVDVDSYAFAVATEGDVLVSITGTGLSAFDFAEVVLLDSQQNPLGFGTFLGGHGVLSAHVPAGNYEVSVDASAPADITAPVPYKVAITSDVAATRCPKIAAAASYTEARDSAANDQAGNDVVTVSFDANGAVLALTAATTDLPEPTGLTITEANFRISGTAKLPTAASPDDYLERDTYLIKTGAATNQPAIRLNWAGQSDFDYFLFTEVTNTTDTPEIVGESDQQMAGEDEFSTFAVLPNTNYWLWIAPFATNATSGPLLPATYDASVCGETFTP